MIFEFPYKIDETTGNLITFSLRYYYGESGIHYDRKSFNYFIFIVFFGFSLDLRGFYAAVRCFSFNDLNVGTCGCKVHSILVRLTTHF